MSKYKYHIGVDVAYGDDNTEFSCFRKRQIRWWERLLMKVFKNYEIKQPLELVDSWTIPHKKAKS